MSTSDGSEATEAILERVRANDSEGASDLIAEAVEADNTNAVTEAAVKARDEGLIMEMTDSLTLALLKGVSPSDIREAFTVLGGGG